MQTMQDVPLILRREIEARMIAPFLEAFSEAFGEEKTLEVARSVMSRLARDFGRQLAQRVDEPTLPNFMEHINPVFQPAEYCNIKEVSEECVRMDITYCAYVEMYERIGLKKYGPLLSCERDRYLFEGYNGSTFTRTKTLMEGGDCCDFCIEKRK